MYTTFVFFTPNCFSPVLILYFFAFPPYFLELKTPPFAVLHGALFALGLGGIICYHKYFVSSQKKEDFNIIIGTPKTTP